jgi:hypothetical protein
MAMGNTFRKRAHISSDLLVSISKLLKLPQIVPQRINLIADSVSAIHYLTLQTKHAQI